VSRAQGSRLSPVQMGNSSDGACSHGSCSGKCRLDGRTLGGSSNDGTTLCTSHSGGVNSSVVSVFQICWGEPAPIQLWCFTGVWSFCFGGTSSGRSIRQRAYVEQLLELDQCSGIYRQHDRVVGL